MFRYLPEQASEHAANLDWLHNLITDISVFFTVAIVGAMVYFAIRYQQKGEKPHDTPQILGSHLLEIIWTVVPTIICIIVAYYGVVYYDDTRVVSKDALTVNVWAQKWYWEFEYENGKKTKGELVLPVDRPIKLVMKSRDVLHSFFIPSMRVKKDVIPGSFVYMTFRPIKTGVYQSFCTEYCGLDHSQMLATVRVLPAGEYEQWVGDRSSELSLLRMSPKERGKSLYVAKGCNACHSLDGTRGVGPTFLKLYGRKEELEGGESIDCEDSYLAESMLNPAAKVVKGFPKGVMPSFHGQLSDDDVAGLIAFIKAQDGSSAPIPAAAAEPVAEDAAALAGLTPVQRGQKWYQEKLCITCHSIDGSRLVGPSLKGIVGRTEVLADGSTITADVDYIKESIHNPAAKVVQGYAPAMPPGLINDAQIDDVIEFLKTLK